MINEFKKFWGIINAPEPFEKGETLTKSEILEVQEKISSLQAKGYPSSKIITALQKFNPKLSERWKAARAFWTELKSQDTQLVAEAGKDLGITKYKVILSPNACKLCRLKTDNGKKVFTQREVQKTGYGHYVPWHANCYCISVPFA